MTKPQPAAAPAPAAAAAPAATAKAGKVKAEPIGTEELANRYVAVLILCFVLFVLKQGVCMCVWECVCGEGGGADGGGGVGWGGC
jgi:hypothetical protein